MLTAAHLFNLSKPLPEEYRNRNKYTYFGCKYKFPNYRVLNIGDIVSSGYKKDVDLPSYIFDFIGVRGEVLLLANIVNRKVPQVALRDFNSKEFSVMGSQSGVPYGLGFLRKDFKYGDPIILVEGTADRDFISGIYPNVLAVQSAGMSTMQFEIVKKLTNKVILGYDNDRSGINAKRRDMKRCKENNIQAMYLNHYSEYKDPGDILQLMFDGNEYEANIAVKFYYNQLEDLFRRLNYKWEGK